MAQWRHKSTQNSCYHQRSKAVLKVSWLLLGKISKIAIAKTIWLQQIYDTAGATTIQSVKKDRQIYQSCPEKSLKSKQPNKTRVFTNLSKFDPKVQKFSPQIRYKFDQTLSLHLISSASHGFQANSWDLSSYLPYDRSYTILR